MGVSDYTAYPGPVRGAIVVPDFARHPGSVNAVWHFGRIGGVVTESEPRGVAGGDGAKCREFGPWDGGL